MQRCDAYLVLITEFDGNMGKRRESEICFRCRNNFDFFSGFWACCWKVWGTLDLFYIVYVYTEKKTYCLHFPQERLICVWSMNVWVNNEFGHVLSVTEGFVFLLCKTQKLPWLSFYEWALGPVVSGVMRTEHLASSYAYIVMHMLSCIPGSHDRIQWEQGMRQKLSCWKLCYWVHAIEECVNSGSHLWSEFEGKEMKNSGMSFLCVGRALCFCFVNLKSSHGFPPMREHGLL